MQLSCVPLTPSLACGRLNRLVPHLLLDAPLAVRSPMENERHLAEALERRFTSGELHDLVLGAPLRCPRAGDFDVEALGLELLHPRTRHVRDHSLEERSNGLLPADRRHPRQKAPPLPPPKPRDAPLVP